MDDTNSEFAFWHLTLTLAGEGLLNSTNKSPLGALPVPLRNAVLLTAHDSAPERVELKIRSEQLRYTPSSYEFLDYYRFPDAEFRSFLKDFQIDGQPGFTSPEDYYTHYRLREEDTEHDEHYAERAFVETVFLPIFRIQGLNCLQPQVQFSVTGGRLRRIDFVLRGEKNYAIEIEGETFHGGSENFVREKNRQQELSRAGYSYFPLSYASIRDGSALADFWNLVEDDPILVDLASVSAETIENSSSLIRLGRLLRELPERFPNFRRAALAILREACQTPDRPLVIVEYGPRLPLLALALLDMVALLERTAILYDHPLKIPPIEIHQIASVDDVLHRHLLEKYLRSPLGEEDRRADAAITVVQVFLTNQFPLNLNPTLQLALDTPPPSDHIWENVLDRERFATLVNSLGVPVSKCFGNYSWRICPDDRRILDYFARRFFPVPELKSEQVILIQRVLQGRSGLGLLPTGFGKSLVFQLSALLIPATTLVISPLRALIRDQIYALRRYGLTAIGEITSNDSAAEKKEKLKNFSAGHYRILYISPERLQIKGFYDELQIAMATALVGILVVDEAHCVSEWGHDFRPAYLQIARLHRRLNKAAGRQLPLLALTATASTLSSSKFGSQLRNMLSEYAIVDAESLFGELSQPHE